VTRSVLVRAAVLLGAALLFTGCATPAPTAEQRLVESAASAVESGDTATALEILNELEAALTEEVSAGRMSSADAEAARATIAGLRAELAPEPSPEPEPEPEPAATPTPASSDEDDEADDEDEPGPPKDKDDKRGENRGKGPGKDDDG
jgi:hypothetical protein